MRSILLIGMGKFGQLLGENLLEMGDEVMIADRNEAIINALAPKYSGSLIANCMNADNLKALDIPSFAVCVVTIAEDFQASLEITSLLKDLGAKYVVSRAETAIQRKFLLRVGADEVVYPNRDIAEKLAMKLNIDKVYDYFEIDADHSIFELAVPSPWIGHSMVDVNPRQFGLNILTIKKGNKVLPPPGADYVFGEGEHMVIFGNTQQIIKFANKTSNKVLGKKLLGRKKDEDNDN